MTLTLELSDDLQSRLRTEAERLGLPLEQYALQLLGAVPGRNRQPKNGAELVEFWRREGVIGSWPEIDDSQAFVRENRRRAEKRNLDW